MVIYLIIILAVAARFVPHMPNAAPITALAIFSATYLPWKKSVGLTLAARLLSDVFLGFFAWPLMVAVYLSHLAGVLFGLWIKRSFNVIPEATRSEATRAVRNPVLDPGSWMHSAGTTKARWFKIIFSSLSASVVFFSVTNFAFLYATYPHDFTGILAAYTNGLPFFRGTVLGDLGYTVALFLGYEVVRHFFAARKFRKAALI